MQQRADQDYRTRIYQSYNDWFVTSSQTELRARAPFLRRLIRDHFPSERGARILEIGCGYGALLHFARAAGYSNFHGIDNSPSQLAQADAIGAADLVSKGEAGEYIRSLPGASLDAIVALDMVEHLTKPEAVALVDGVFRTLQPGGKFIIHTVNADSPFFGGVRYGDFTHENAFTRESITQLLRSSGFARVVCFEDTPIVHGAKSAMRLAIWKIWRAILRTCLMAETGAASAILTRNFLAVGYR